MAFEGKELEGKIGEFGSYHADVSDQGYVEVGLSLKIDLLAELEKLAAKTEITLDDTFIATVKKLMGR